jgi:HPt (histidine-containing phosphotransfer) domain-containing protein
VLATLKRLVDPEAAAAPDALDRVALLSRVHHDSVLLAEVAALFRSEYPRLLGEARAAGARGDGPALAAAAHTLKGMVGNLTASAALDRACELEDAGRVGEFVRVPRALADLEAETTRLTRELAACQALLAERSRNEPLLS